MSVKLISPKQFDSLRGTTPGAVLLDVRSPGEFSAVHAAGAVNLPLDRVNPDAVRTLVGQRTAYVICKSGGRAGKACQQLMQSGFDDVISIEGGTDAWVAAGLDVVRGQGVISIERQVRIGAGLLVLIGTLLGAFVSPYFLILSGFVGAGLTFAGVTDFCGMGMILARMPWNQRGTPGTGAACATH